MRSLVVDLFPVCLTSTFAEFAVPLPGKVFSFFGGGWYFFGII